MGSPPPSMFAQINSFAFVYAFVNIHLKDTVGQSANQKLAWFLHKVLFMIFFRMTPTLSAFVSTGTFLLLCPQQKKTNKKSKHLKAQLGPRVRNATFLDQRRSVGTLRQ